MYLSQPRDLIPSMSAGCSRGTLLLPSQDLLAASSSSSSSSTASTIKSPSPLVLAHEDPRNSRPHSSPDHHLLLPSYTSPTASAKTATATLPTTTTQSRWFRSQHFQTVWDKLDPGSASTRPPHPYTELIKLCILKRREGKLTLNQLYRDLEEKFPFFATSQKGKGWKNTLRHNLSTQPYFIKLEREHGQLGKGHYWAYDPELEKPTSLAQSSVVQLSWLWPPSVSAATGAVRQEAMQGLPRFESFQTIDQRGGYRTPEGAYSITMHRRRSSPTHPYEHPPVGTRMRSATISTIHRPTVEEGRQRRRDSSSSASFWTATSTLSSDVDDSDQAAAAAGRGSRLPPLPEIGAQTRGKSLSDYWLSHPISRR